MGSVPSLLRKRHGGAIPKLGYSGRVFLAGPSAPSDFREPGTAVFGTVHLSAAVAGGVGTLAEYILVPADSVVRKPENLSFAEAAGGLGCLAQTGLNMVIRGWVKNGDRVLVNGASGGVGSVALMAAKAAGAKEVVATCLEESMEIVHQKFGADEASSPYQWRWD
jgi:NADPH:quinone reductase-like Zn-dependent oxidoreductase